MRFNILVVDPPTSQHTHFLHYFCKLLCRGLESLNHDCIVSRNTVDRTRTTIVVAGHLLSSPDEVRFIADAGPFIVLQTELIHDARYTFWSADSRRLSEIYLPLLRRASAVWEVIPHQLPLLAQQGIQGQVFLGGYHPALEEVVHKKEKDIDFLFFGSLTDHRKRQLEKLSRYGRRLVVAFDEHAIFRNDLIARTKVNLSMRTTETTNHLPWGRVCDLLNNRCLVVSERCANQDWLEDCFVSADSDAWPEACQEILLRSDRDALTEQNWELFRQRPFATRLERLLDELPAGIRRT